ncbi:TetR/AcrR family transcriptional regulator C-terminal domain-containing protein [Nesterenkonia sp. K-15-9-6]|uniref:TetR/AcrR family transcriptional regulator C-terminal domain-containing protein n=1 Tax=Nesterenkonia sp. K-15-9-6 TaxID=3093918 RepID=UPI004044A1B9
MDEVTLIGLLWRESAASSRRGISTRGITTLGVDLADREGLDAVTIRRLAAEAGVTAMALYPHIGGRAELIELMLDHVAGATYETAAAPDGEDWRERLTVIADANWASCHAHPWITDLATGRPVPGPGASAKFETELRALDGIGLTDIEMEQTLTALLSLVKGTARASLAAQASREQGEDRDVDWWSTIGPALTAAIGNKAQFPVATRVSRALGDLTGKANDPEGAYRRGLSLLLDGIAQQLDDR